MTTQVAVLNKMGLAVASDSVVTMANNGSSKTLSNARKILALGEKHKILVLTAGDVDLNKLPVGLYVTRWAKSLKEPLANPKAYAQDFVDWLAKNGTGPNMSDLEAIREVAVHLLVKISSDINEALGSDVPETWETELSDWLSSDPANAKKYQKISKEKVEQAIASLDGLYNFKFFNQDVAQKSLSSTDAKKMVNDWFLDKALTPSLRQKLVDALPVSLGKRMKRYHNQSTLSFMGYGAESITPSGIQLILEGALPGMIRGWFATELEAMSGSTIYYPARDEAVRSFLNGYDDEILDRLPDFLKNALQETVVTVRESIPKVSAQLQQIASHDLVVDGVVESLREAITEYGRNHFTNLLDTIEAMDLSAIAEIAENLTGLQILAAQNSTDNPHSGGIIEVATIDLENGVKWHRRIPLTKSGMSDL